MIHGYHVVWGVYGFWLPNDPRGSWSDFVYAWELTRFGKASKSIDRVEVAPAKYVAWRTAAQRTLKYPAVTLTGRQAQAVGQGFQNFARKSRIAIWACSILPDHVHIVVGRLHYKIEQATNLLKGAAQRSLVTTGRHPLAAYRTPQGRIPSVWSDKRWKVYLDSEEAIECAIRYVEQNPIRESKPRQTWSFVRPFSGLDSSGWTTYH